MAILVSRVYTISPRQGECFYLRLLLHNVKGPQLFAALRTVNDDLCSSFHKACFRMGLLEDDPSNPMEIYDNHKEAMAEDF